MDGPLAIVERTTADHAPGTRLRSTTTRRPRPATRATPPEYQQNVRGGWQRGSPREANIRFHGTPPASDKIQTSLQTAPKDITHAAAKAAAALRLRRHYMYRQALQPPARRRCGRFGRCVTCTGRADTASVNSTLALRNEIADLAKNAMMSSRTGSILLNHDRMRQAFSGPRSAAPGARHVDFQGPLLEKLRQDQALARAPAHRHYPLTGNGVVTMRVGADAGAGVCRSLAQLIERESMGSIRQLLLVRTSSPAATGIQARSAHDGFRQTGAGRMTGWLCSEC